VMSDETSAAACAGAVAIATRAFAEVRLPRVALPARAPVAPVVVAPREAVRRALERCGRVRGRFASTPPSRWESSLVFVSATAHIIA
jgi:hypothetical protein